MTISSIGYAGTVTDVEWARLAGLAAGSRYGVDGWSSLRVTPTSGTRTVQVATGSGWGWGVLDTNDAPVNLSLDSVPSGSRWDLIVAHRDWGTGTTTFAVVAGGSSRALPPRDDDPGVEDDQPLALVRVAAGSTEIQEVVDLRVIASTNGAVGFDSLVLSYLNSVGAQITIGGSLWTRTVSNLGVESWMETVIDVPAGRASRSTTAAVAHSGSLTHVRIGLVDSSVAGGVTFSAGGQFVAPRDGLYSLTARAVFSPNGTGYRGVSFVLGNTNIVEPVDVPAVSGSGRPTYVTTSTIRRLVSGQAVGLGVAQSSGADLNVTEAVLGISFEAP